MKHPFYVAWNLLPLSKKKKSLFLYCSNIYFSATSFECPHRESGDVFEVTVPGSTSEFLSPRKTKICFNPIYVFILVCIVLCWFLSHSFMSCQSLPRPGKRKLSAACSRKGRTNISGWVIVGLWGRSWSFRQQWKNSHWSCKVSFLTSQHILSSS